MNLVTTDTIHMDDMTINFVRPHTFYSFSCCYAKSKYVDVQYFLPSCCITITKSGILEQCF